MPINKSIENSRNDYSSSQKYVIMKTMTKLLFTKDNKINVGRTPWNKGKKGLQKAWNKGKKCPWVTKRNLEINHLMIGNKAYHWKGGKTSRERKILMGRKVYQQFRSNVLERDSWTCQTCQIRGIELHVHHIKPWAEYPELRYDVTNGVTLCRQCHELTYKRTNNKN